MQHIGEYLVFTVVGLTEESFTEPIEVRHFEALKCGVRRRSPHTSYSDWASQVIVVPSPPTLHHHLGMQKIK